MTARSVRVRPLRAKPDTSRVGSDMVRHGHASHKLARNEVNAVGLPEPVNGNDCLVVQPRRDLALMMKASEGYGIAGEVGEQDLEGDRPFQRNFLGKVDDTHPTAANLSDDAIVADRLVFPAPI